MGDWGWLGKGRFNKNCDYACGFVEPIMAAEAAMNTLLEPLVSVSSHDERVSVQSLPGLLAALARGEVAGYPAQRAHQRHAFHAFTVQLAAIALHRAGLSAPPQEEAAWRDLLRALTPEFPDDEPWRLISPPDKPALLQAPLPGGKIADLKNRMTTPDQLDMLVTSRNHDIKQAVMTDASLEDWLFALVTLQTMEGIMGAPNKGISRMDGGYGNRAAISVAPPGGASEHWRRDARRLLELRGSLAPAIYPAIGGISLLWLELWDGLKSLNPGQLDEFYIEICRRVRLTEKGGRVVAFAGGSEVRRVLPIPGGVTGDPWSPVEVEKGGKIKALTVNAAGFGYRRMAKFLFDKDIAHAPLQEIGPDDAEQGLHVLARALVRGRGKTEGYHERRVPLSRKASRGRGRAFFDEAGTICHQRVELAGAMQNGVLKFALFVLFQNGPEKVKMDDKGSQAKAEPFLRRFDAEVDRSFFPDLWDEVEAEPGDDTDTARHEARCAWVNKLYRLGETLLSDAEHEVARSSRRSYRAVARARDALWRAAHYRPKLKDYFEKEEAA
jgi:CRISPR system Cascade subunit CasA